VKALPAAPIAVMDFLLSPVLPLNLDQVYCPSNDSPPSSNPPGRITDAIAAGFTILLVVGASLWVGHAMTREALNVWHVLVVASITALTTGFGAIPFLFVGEVSKRWLGIGNALAAGLMLGASIGLLLEGYALKGVDHNLLRLLAGTALGVIAILIARKCLAHREEDFSIGNVQGADATKMLLLVGIMTAHSFAEGIGVGVSFGDGHSFGAFISIAIAVHNIPEGLAISLILIPRGLRVHQAGLWSIFSSLPQPLLAVPAFLFVLLFRPLLPVGLGLAAGAMIWMVFSELLPEARENLPLKLVLPLSLSAVFAMLAFQFLIG